MNRYWIALAAVVGSGCVHANTNTHMWQHFDAAADAHNAVLRGQMDQVRLAGAWLAEHPGADLPEGSDSLVERMRWYGRQVATASDVSEAAYGTAGIARTCGECHRAFGPGPLFLGEGVPLPPADDLTRAMRRHGWAANRMWEGLIGPSDSAWAVGARVMQDAPMDPGRVTTDERVAIQVGALETRVRELGLRAVNATSAEGRARIYGDVISTCAACHMLVRGVL